MPYCGMTTLLIRAWFFIVVLLRSLFRSHHELTKHGKSKFPVSKRLVVLTFSTLATCLIFNGDALIEKSWASSNDATWIKLDGETYGAQADQLGPIGAGAGTRAW